ncbi:MAG: metal ABC transporter substrate-binding protein [Anaerolineales bacterium]
MYRFIIILTLITLTLTGCRNPASNSGTPFDPTQGRSAPVILTSTTILADITRNIAGDRLNVDSLLPIGTDPHSYQPTPQDVAKLTQSKVLVINGLDYESFLQPLLDNAGGERTVIEASTGISPREEAGSIDPHMWLDPNNVIRYVENIRDGLIQFDPAGEAIYKTNADKYVRELTELNTWIDEQVQEIPLEKRLLVTNHEALGYFAERYEFKVVGTVVESFSSDASPSAQQMAGLIDQIKSSGAPAIFLDAGDSTSLAQQIANETSVRVVTDLHLESLTDGAPAATYIDLMKHNVTQIVNALK